MSNVYLFGPLGFIIQHYDELSTRFSKIYHKQMNAEFLSINDLDDFDHLTRRLSLSPDYLNIRELALALNWLREMCIKYNLD